jgi:hypothetical protein
MWRVYCPSEIDAATTMMDLLKRVNPAYKARLAAYIRLHNSFL